MSEVSFMEFLKYAKFNFKKAKKYREEYFKIMEAGVFDKNFYLRSYPNVKISGMDPLVHFLFYGAHEGKKPSYYFDTLRYMEKNPEIGQKNINPLIYYIDNTPHEFLSEKNQSIHKKRKIISSNKAFLANYEFDDEPLVSIIVLNRNGLGHLKRLFKDFDEKTNYGNYEIIVVDNASCDESVDYLNYLKKDLPITIIENNENVSFSKGNNDAAKIAKGKYLLFLNNDIEPTYGWLNELVGVAENNDNIGAVGSKLIFPYFDDIDMQPKSYSIQHAGVKFREDITPYIYGPYHEAIEHTLIFGKDLNRQKEVISNTAACILIPKEIYEDLDGFDEEYVYGYEDIDFAFKLKENGYESIFNPHSLLFHHESATRLEDNDKKNQLNYQNIMHFYHKWGKQLFKYILDDKINEKFFFTNKKIDITVIARQLDSPFIRGFVQKLNSKYNVTLISDMEIRELSHNCDIAISFERDFDLDNAMGRLNLIRMFYEDGNLILKGIDELETCDKTFGIKSENGEDFACEVFDIIKDTYLELSD